MAIAYQNKEFVKTFFAPKSLMKDGCLPDWFLFKKYDEIRTPAMIGYDTKGVEDYLDEEQHLVIVTTSELVNALA